MGCFVHGLRVGVGRINNGFYPLAPDQASHGAHIQSPAAVADTLMVSNG
jgi:hypothetical protein